jgi:hypothetical protein
MNYDSEHIKQLSHFISQIKPFFIETRDRKPYYHMGATITDVILQAGLNYKNVVYPRVRVIIDKYSYYKTTSRFIILFKTIPLNDILNWKDNYKTERIKKLTYFLYNLSIETEEELSKWLKENDNVNHLLQLDGIGPKTVDYIKKMVGIPSISVDRHMFKFLELAGIKTSEYDYAKFLLKKTSQYLNMSYEYLDSNIWNFMSSKMNIKLEYNRMSITQSGSDKLYA